VLRFALGLTAVLVLLIGQHTILAAERFNRSFPEGFDEGQYVASKAGGQPITVRYRLFRRRPLDPAVRYPLLIWLHGEGEAGDDNSLQLRWLDLVFRVGTTRGDYPFFVLATQCPSDQRAWAASGSGPPDDHSGNTENSADPLAITYDVFKHLLESEPIDPDRVYVAGVSSGGTATWQLAIRHPEDFAALAPMSSRGANLQTVARLVHVPVWAFHAEDDRGSPVDKVRQTVAALQQAGGSSALTLV